MSEQVEAAVTGDYTGGTSEAVRSLTPCSNPCRIPTQAPLAPALIPFETRIYGDAGLIPGWGRCPGEGKSNPLQYSCLGNSMDREVWWAIVHVTAKESDRI